MCGYLNIIYHKNPHQYIHFCCNLFYVPNHFTVNRRDLLVTHCSKPKEKNHRQSADVARTHTHTHTLYSNNQKASKR